MSEYVWSLTQKELHHKMNFAYEQGVANERQRIIELVRKQPRMLHDQLINGEQLIVLIEEESE